MPVGVGRVAPPDDAPEQRDDKELVELVDAYHILDARRRGVALQVAGAVIVAAAHADGGAIGRGQAVAETYLEYIVLMGEGHLLPEQRKVVGQPLLGAQVHDRILHLARTLGPILVPLAQLGVLELVVPDVVPVGAPGQTRGSGRARRGVGRRWRGGVGWRRRQCIGRCGRRRIGRRWRERIGRRRGERVGWRRRQCIGRRWRERIGWRRRERVGWRRGERVGWRRRQCIGRRGCRCIGCRRRERIGRRRGERVGRRRCRGQCIGWCRRERRGARRRGRTGVGGRPGRRAGPRGRARIRRGVGRRGRRQDHLGQR